MTPFFNFPPMDGGSVRSINIFNELNKKNDLFLLTYPCKNLSKFISPNRITFVDSRVNKPKRKNIITRFISTSAPGFSSHNPLSIESSITNLIKKNGEFDIIYFSTQLMAQVLLYKNWNSLIFIDFFDIYSSVIERKIMLTKKTSPYNLIFYKELRKILSIERKISRKSDLIIAISNHDRNILKKYTSNKCITLQNGVRIPSKKWDNSSNKKIMMVGNFYHEPNIEGLNWFLNKVWKNIIQCNQNYVFDIVGQFPKEYSYLSLEFPNINLKGEIKKLGDLYRRSGCAIVPIRYGGGINHKVLEAMAYGIPIVSTSFGARGISHDGMLNIADTPKIFEESIIHILENPKMYYKNSKTGRNVIKSKYKWEIQCKHLMDEVKLLKNKKIFL